MAIRKITESGTRFGAIKSMRWRPSARNASENLPFATDPSGRLMPVEIERPSVGIRCAPTKKNIMPSVASRSGTRIFTTRSPLTRPTKAPIARQISTAESALISHTTMT